MRIEGRGELFVRLHRHADPDGADRAAAARLDGVQRPPVLHRLRGARRALLVRRHRPPRPRARAAHAGHVHAGGRRRRCRRARPRSSASARSSPSATRWAGRSACTSPGATPTSSPASSCRPPRWSGAAPGGSGRCGGSCPSPGRGCAAAATAATSTGPSPKLLGVDHPLEPYVPWLVSEMSRNDAFAMVDAGRALARYDARPWAATLGVPAASLITTEDRLVPPAQAAGARRRRSARTPRAGRPTTSPPLSHPRRVRRAHRRAGRPRRAVSDGRRPAATSPAPGAPDRRSRPVRRARATAGPRASRQVGELVPELLAGDDVGQHQAHAGDLAGQELGVGLGALGDAAVELGLHPVALLLAVLGQQDQRRGVGRLQSRSARFSRMNRVPRVPTQLSGADQVPGDPDDDDDRLDDQEPGGAEGAGDRLAEPAERLGVVAARRSAGWRGVVRSSRRLTIGARPVVRSRSRGPGPGVTPRWRQPPAAGGRARRRP